MKKRALPSWLVGVVGGVVIIAAWWILAITVFAPRSGRYAPIPTPPAVIKAMFGDGWAFYAHHFGLTLTEAGWGFVWGNGIALVLCALVLVVPRLEGVVTQVAVITYCVPIVAIGPLALIIIGPPPSGQPSGTAVFLAGLSVFFTTVVGTLLGLKAADRASLDVVSVYGGSKFTQLRKVRLIAALPQILSALQIAVPAAFLGAILGEYLGQVDAGVGPIMVAAQVQLQASRVWAIALICGAVSLAGFGFFGLIARFISPWSRGAAGR